MTWSTLSAFAQKYSILSLCGNFEQAFVWYSCWAVNYHNKYKSVYFVTCWYFAVTTKVLLTILFVHSHFITLKMLSGLKTKYQLFKVSTTFRYHFQNMNVLMILYLKKLIAWLNIFNLEPSKYFHRHFLCELLTSTNNN